MDSRTGGANTNSRETVLSGAEVARLRAKPVDGKLPTFEAIGKRFGVSRQAAWKAYKRYTTQTEAAA